MGNAFVIFALFKNFINGGTSKANKSLQQCEMQRLSFLNYMLKTEQRNTELNGNTRALEETSTVEALTESG